MLVCPPLLPYVCACLGVHAHTHTQAPTPQASVEAKDLSLHTKQLCSDGTVFLKCQSLL